MFGQYTSAQVANVRICVPFDTTKGNIKNGGNPTLFFSNNKTPSFGYVTLFNSKNSVVSAQISSDESGETSIFDSAIEPNNSVTIFLPSLQDLYVFSTVNGKQVLGEITVNVIRTVHF